MLLNHLPIPEGKFMLIEPGLVRCPDFLVFRDPECPRTHVRYKTDIYGPISPWRVLSICSALLVFMDVSSASESSVIRDISIFTLRGLVRRHSDSDALLECHIAGIFACCCGPEPKLASEAGFNHYDSCNQHNSVDR